MKKILLCGAALLLLCGCQPLIPKADPGINRQLDSDISIEGNKTVLFLVLTDVDKSNIVEDIKALQTLQAEQTNDLKAEIPLVKGEIAP